MIIDPAISLIRATRKTERTALFTRPISQAAQINDAKQRVLDWMAFRWQVIKETAPNTTERNELVTLAKQQLKNLIRTAPFGFTQQQVFDWLDARIDEIRAGDIFPPVVNIHSVAVGSPSVADNGRLAIAYFDKIFIISAAASARYNEFFAFPAFQTNWGNECPQDWLEIYGSPAISVVDTLPVNWTTEIP